MRALRWFTGIFALGAIALIAWLIVGPTLFKAPPVPDLPAATRVDPMVAQAVMQAASIARQQPRSADARMQLAMTLHANGLHEQARLCYQHALELDPGQYKAWSNIAWIDAERGDVEAALTAIDRAIAIDDSHAAFHWRRGYWLLDLNRLHHAKTAFETALQLDAGSTAARVGLARVHLQQQEDAAAETLLTQAIADDPRHQNITYMRQLLGTAQRNLGKRAAISDLAQTSGRTPTWSDRFADEVTSHRTGFSAMLQEAQSLLQAGKAQQAMTAVQNALRARPGDVAALNTLAAAQFDLMQVDQGIATLEVALRVDPNQYATHMNLAYGYESKGDAAKAMQHARRAAECNPSLGEAHVQVARLLLLQEQATEAAEYLKRAIATGAASPEVRTLLGEVHLHLHEWARAQTAFAQALQVAPDHAAATAGLARAIAEQGDMAQAARLIQRARELQPDNPIVAGHSRRIRELQFERGGMP